jgi:hypothetical protein
MRPRLCWAMMFVLLCPGCPPDNPATDGNSAQSDADLIQSWPPVEVAAQLPIFTRQVNEIEIADGFSKVSTTMVLGAVVELASGTVSSLDSCLKSDAKPETRAVLELVFKKFLENSVVANAEWLSYLKGQVNDTTRAEVTVTEVSDASIDISSIDEGKLQTVVSKIPADQRDNYGIVIGYRDFALAASLFREQGIEGQISGYGAKIGGKWFGKHEDVTMDHRIVAVWCPLPFVVETVSNRIAASPKTSFTEITSTALNRGDIHIKAVAEPKAYVLRRQP